jgi:hypothetical protein
MHLSYPLLSAVPSHIFLTFHSSLCVTRLSSLWRLALSGSLAFLSMSFDLPFLSRVLVSLYLRVCFQLPFHFGPNHFLLCVSTSPRSHNKISYVKISYACSTSRCLYMCHIFSYVKGNTAVPLTYIQSFCLFYFRQLR